MAQSEDITTITPEFLAQLQEMVGKQKPEKKKANKPERSEFVRRFAYHMNGLGKQNWPEFPVTFHIVSDAKGIKKPLIEEGGVCRYVDEELVSGIIYSYCIEVLSLHGVPEAKIMPEDARTLYKGWKDLTTPTSIDNILPLVQKSKPEKCWHRLPFDFPKEVSPTPTFDEIFSRMSNAHAMRCFIGSLFFKDADRQQYVWIYGEGQNGKGAIARFLHTILGPTYSTQQPPAPSDRFWLSGILGARLVVFPDCDSAKFPTTGLFKSITGGDAQRIEEKGKPVYTAELNCKMLFFSNDKPAITGQTADTRRAIYCSMEPISGPMIAVKTYQRRLMEEAPSFLSKCIAEYLKACPDHETIPTDTAELQEVIRENEEQWEFILKKYFAVAPRQQIEEKTLRRQFYTERHLVADALKQEGIRSNQDISKFKKYLEKRHGVKVIVERQKDNHIVRLYAGICSLNEAKNLGSVQPPSQHVPF